MNRSTPIGWAIVSTLILLASAGWVWASRAAPGETTQGDIPAPQKGFLAPDFSLQTASGETTTLSQLRGRPVLVNMWASWCPPCRAEMPALQEAYEKFGPQGLVILGVDAANQDDTVKAIQFAGEQGLTFPILLDTQGEVGQRYQVRALPSSFFIDSKGIIQEVVIGGPISEALLQIRIGQLFKLGGEEIP